MKTTERFDRAVKKLYEAFHSGNLNRMDCEACAVGNICGGKSDWRYVEEYGMADQAARFNLKPQETIKATGYDIKELMAIEKIFMYGRNWWVLEILFNRKEWQFQALCDVVEYLCELDNIPNVMDYTKLFETNEKNEPIYQIK